MEGAKRAIFENVGHVSGLVRAHSEILKAADGRHDNETEAGDNSRGARNVEITKRSQKTFLFQSTRFLGRRTKPNSCFGSTISL